MKIEGLDKYFADLYELPPSSNPFTNMSKYFDNDIISKHILILILVSLVYVIFSSKKNASEKQKLNTDSLKKQPKQTYEDQTNLLVLKYQTENFNNVLLNENNKPMTKM